MGEKIIVGPLNRGLRNDVRPFNIDNESFPILINAYQWRGRVKRKRGTSLLNRLKRFFNSANSSYGSITSFNLVAGAGNILTAFGLETNGNIVPGSVTLTDATAGNTYTDDSAGNLIGVPGGTGTINYATGAITISGGGADLINAVSFNYYPDLPVMGLEDFDSASRQFPGTLGFDTKYSYNINTAFPYSIYDVSFYKNPLTATYPGYVEKTNITAATWNGQDYQQFWTVNYQGALWATNGITEPFTTTNIGMQFSGVTAVAIGAGGPPAIVTITTTTNHGLVIGDFVFINEIVGMTGINFQTGYVTATPAANQITVEFPNATIGGAWASGGIVQYLTNRSDATKDCIRWYDGDPTDGNATTPTLNGHLGWVNFCPPLSQSNFSIADRPAAQYYLVGARMIIPFKDRLLFLGPVIQTSSVNSQIYLQDTVIYSQNGTPYYTCSFTDPTSNYPLTPTTPPGYVPILVPADQTATPSAYFEDISGFGGFITAGIDQEIVTANANEDVLIVGFTRQQTRLVYSGNDIVPFNFFIINSEYGSGSTFSTINTDKGVLTKGSRGYLITGQTESRRIDLEIPDEVFQTRYSDNGTERVCAQRDYINEWIYFTYPVNAINYKFPTQTLQYNYRDDSWGIFRESYTTYGLFRKQTGFTWATVGTVYPTWASWTAPWNSGTSTLLQPNVIAGNQQGFVLVRDDGTNEGDSLYIRDITNSIVTSPDHCLNTGDYIVISGTMGSVAGAVNGKIFSIQVQTKDTFLLNPPLVTGLTYIGGGVIKRMYVPFVQSKQFPVAWGFGRKTRLGPQQYLLSTTDNGQITLLIYLSQDSDNPYNNLEYPYAVGIVPQVSQNNSLIYSTTLYTCPESANLGLTPANTNLQMISNINSAGTNASSPQAEIWHRMNTSLIGDTVQIGFTLNDAQMRDIEFNNQFEEIELHSFILDVNPSQLLA
jgi:hypothetical protein